MSNYPPGSENDPNAPWNRKDVKVTKWESCGLLEMCETCLEDGDVNEDGVCENCFQPEEIEEDPDDDGDAAYDSWKDSQLEET